MSGMNDEAQHRGVSVAARGFKGRFRPSDKDPYVDRAGLMPLRIPLLPHARRGPRSFLGRGTMASVTFRPPTRATPLSPKKLLNSKWTAVSPRNKERHFLVTKVIEPEPPGAPVELVEIEAVISKRARVIPWRELDDPKTWRRGWL